INRKPDSYERIPDLYRQSQCGIGALLFGLSILSEGSDLLPSEPVLLSFSFHFRFPLSGGRLACLISGTGSDSGDDDESGNGVGSSSYCRAVFKHDKRRRIFVLDKCGSIYSATAHPTVGHLANSREIYSFALESVCLSEIGRRYCSVFFLEERLYESRSSSGKRIRSDS